MASWQCVGNVLAKMLQALCTEQVRCTVNCTIANTLLQHEVGQCMVTFPEENFPSVFFHAVATDWREVDDLGQAEVYRGI